ncbi:MAG: prepilin peptidase [Anaerolineae bacterium]
MPALYALLGLVVGSFLNVVIDRMPAKESLIQPPSHCDGCGRRLTAWDMVPVFSYIALRGRCRTCGARIPLRVPVVEALTALAFAALWWVHGPGLRLILDTVFASILLPVLFIDLEHKRVLNAMILPATILAALTIPLQLLYPPAFGHYGSVWLLLGGAAGQVSPVVAAMLSQLLGGVAAFAIFLIIWLIAPQGMGAGDVKLAAFAGIVVAFSGAIMAVLASFVLGGVVAAVLLLSGKANRKTALPFAPFLVITTFAVMLYGDQLLHWYLFR